MNHYVMDYETIINCFVACFEHYKKDETKVFVIHKSKNQVKELLNFLNQNASNNEWHISYNGLAFDSQITQYLLHNQEVLYEEENGESIANWIYEYAQYIIDKKNEGGFGDFSEKELSIRQIDVFKLNHWDNPAKASSLKWIEFTSKWHNILDMPLHHAAWIESNQIDTIIDYCLNDVKATKWILYQSKDQIDLRKTLTNEYGINLFSASEPKMSKELFLYFLSKKTGISKSDLRKQRTFREKIIVKDILLDYIKFETKEFQELHEAFKEVEIDPLQTKDAFKYNFLYKGVKTVFGLGGLHGAIEKGIYRSNEQMVIMTSDVTSFYPNLAIQNQWAPAHLPKEEFCEQYQWFFDERRKLSKKDPKNYVYKIILNSTYGLSNDKDCFLYDPEFTMRITMNGQLSLCMLYEMLTQGIPHCFPIMQNTDGLETMIPIKYIDKYLEICAEWERITKLQLEHDQYNEMIIADVNNYIAVLKNKEVSKQDYDKLMIEFPHYKFTELDGKYYYNATKCKGRFEFFNLALHKNHSSLVIPKAIYNYFIKDQNPDEYINNNKNIFDFCIGTKIRGSDWVFKDNDGVPQQKVLRLLVSKKGNKYFKFNVIDKRIINVIAGENKQTLLNKIDINKPFDEYDIDKLYYLGKVEEEITKIIPTYKQQQLSLF